MSTLLPCILASCTSTSKHILRAARAHDGAHGVARVGQLDAPGAVPRGDAHRGTEPAPAQHLIGTENEACG
ncbi:hypothetical protein [Enorma phocaeensis]|uniref:hypothetical protein n=1 Tax=Enorma phocaeensis TaxID=1871019 RepID=UPI00195CE1FB|nr:hypothetical protein [Enorma phocaeensis]MBM6953866.1 hypothetical protein [Enorma phocaeensis]